MTDSGDIKKPLTDTELQSLFFRFMEDQGYSFSFAPMPHGRFAPAFTRTKQAEAQHASDSEAER